MKTLHGMILRKDHFREDFFPSIDIPGIPHKQWVLENIPILPGLHTEICRIIKSKLDAGVFELSNSSYQIRMALVCFWKNWHD